jgi:hypothetical protein
MKGISFFLLTSLLPLLTFTGCTKDDEIVPQKAILGKWELVELGNYPDMRPYTAGGYTEYQPDSIFRYFDYELNCFTLPAKYWFDGPYYFEGYEREDGYLIVVKFTYSFQNDKLRLDFASAWAMFKTSIFQRIE